MKKLVVYSNNVDTYLETDIFSVCACHFLWQMLSVHSQNLPTARDLFAGKLVCLGE